MTKNECDFANSPESHFHEFPGLRLRPLPPTSRQGSSGGKSEGGENAVNRLLTPIPRGGGQGDGAVQKV